MFVAGSDPGEKGPAPGKVEPGAQRQWFGLVGVGISAKLRRRLEICLAERAPWDGCRNYGLATCQGG